MIKGIKHIFFDLDHTLWDFEKNSTESLRELFFEFKLVDKISSVENFIESYQKINKEYWALYGAGKIDKETIRYGRFKDVLSLFGMTDEKRSRDIANQYVESTPYKTYLFPGTIEILEYLKKKYFLHIISNGFSEIIDIKMTESCIKHYFELILSSEEVGVHKPNPKVFESALSKTNAKKEESIMIGDNFDADIIGAINFGMKAIFFNPNKEEGNSEITEIHHLSELKKLL